LGNYNPIDNQIFISTSTNYHIYLCCVIR